MTQELRKLAKRLREGQTHDRKTGYLLDQSAVMDESADAIDALLDRLEKAEKDAERYRWLRERYTAVNFDWEESGQQAVIFTADNFPVATASCDETIDRAMEASK